MKTIFTDSYLLVKEPCKSSTRLECVNSTWSYPTFENLRNKEGSLFMYVSDNTHTRAGKDGKSDLALTHGKHISSIYFQNITDNLGWGDVNHTEDALIFFLDNFHIVDGVVSDGSSIEIFVARGQRRARKNLYMMVVDGELDEEIELFRNRRKNDIKDTMRGDCKFNSPL